MKEEIGVWEEAEEKIGSINLVTTPISSISELQKVLMVIDANMMVEKPSFSLLFRGQDSDFPLVPKSLGGDVEFDNLNSVLQEMIALCKNEIGNTCTDNEVYFMMRHAGLPSHLLDFSWQWEVALWFAIHDKDGSLKNRDSSLWVLRPLIRDFCGYDTMNGHMNPVFFPADQQTCERSRRQDGCAYTIRFRNDVNGIKPLPINCDPNYRERLLRIPLAISGYEEFERKSRIDGVGEITKINSPLTQEVIQKCLQIFQRKIGMIDTI